MALDKIAFLPFGKLIDEWRWRGVRRRGERRRTTMRWWRCASTTRAWRRPSRAPRPTSIRAAKYHVPGNVSYTRYFLSFILQFQFHKALWRSGRLQGPAVRVLDATATPRRRRYSKFAACSGREPALAGHARSSSPARAQMDASAIHRLLRAAAGVAQAEQNRAELRLVNAHEHRRRITTQAGLSVRRIYRRARSAFRRSFSR